VGTMQTSTPKSDRAVQTVFSVCVPDEVAVAVMDAVSSVAGSEFIGQFQEYITADKRPQFPDVMKESASCVALIDCDRDPELALETMERMQQTFSTNLHLVAISSKTDSEFLLRAMRSGCRDFLAQPIDPDLLRAALKRFQRGSVLDSREHGKGKVLSLYGVKGGVGTTTMAVHLAIHLVKKHHKKVLVIDHKHELGHVALHLGMKESVYYFDELVRNVDRLDAALLDGFVTRHSSGMEVIPSPDSCGPVQETAPDAVNRVMEYLRTRYDFILLDGSLQNITQLAAVMAASDEVALVSTPDVVALRDLVRRIEHLSAASGFTNKLRVVINRSTSDDAVSAADIETAVRFPIAVAVPNNYADLMRAVNAGEPVSPQQRGAFTQAIAQWANRLVANQSPSPPEVVEPKRRFLFVF
jgi:pilus assembly protein CpaE